MNSTISHTITCPKCGCEFELTEVFRKKIEEDIASKYRDLYRANLKDAEKKAKEAAEKEAEDKYLPKLETLQSQVESKDKKLKALQLKEVELENKEKELDDIKYKLEKDYEEKIKKTREEVTAEAKQKALAEVSVEYEYMKSQVSDYERRCKEAEQLELDVRKQKSQLEEERETFELQKQREIDAAKMEISKKIKAEAELEYNLLSRDKDLELEQLKKQIHQLKTKQGSQQIHGESQELELEEFLSTHFVHDKVKPVPKGVRGADIIQIVSTPFGQECGKIIWESKRTTTKWSDDWLTKLKENQRDAKADIAVIVSQVLPEGVNNIAQRDGIWIVSFAAVYGITLVLREQLLKLYQLKKSYHCINEKAEVLYDYCCSNEFRQKIEGIVEAFTTMRSDLEAEKRSITKHWQKREMQIEKVLKNTTGMYGGLQTLMGTALQEIKALEMPEVKPDEAPLLTIDDNNDLPF